MLIVTFDQPAFTPVRAVQYQLANVPCEDEHFTPDVAELRSGPRTCLLVLKRERDDRIEPICTKTVHGCAHRQLVGLREPVLGDPEWPRQHSDGAIYADLPLGISDAG